jgi:two-component system chemotaxis response regulator CheB
LPNIIVIGASAGGVQSLRDITRPLPADFQAAIFVVMHISPLTPSVLPNILSAGSPLVAAAAFDGDPIEPGRIYVAPPDHHMLVEPGHVRLTRGPKENRHRPAIDPLFRTAARAYGPRVLGIVVSGMLDDGATGLHIIKHEGGIAIVQDPKEAAFPSMPLSAIRAVSVDFILPTKAIAAKIMELVKEPWKGSERGRAREIARDIRGPEDEKMKEDEDERQMGRPSMFTCPDCSGTLWEMEDGDLLRFRCRVGHAFSAEGVRNGYSDSVEGALWTAVRSLEESASLERRMADMAKARGDELSAANFTGIAEDRLQQAAMIRNMLLSKQKSEEEESV